MDNVSIDKCSGDGCICREISTPYLFEEGKLTRIDRKAISASELIRLHREQVFQHVKSLNERLPFYVKEPPEEGGVQATDPELGSSTLD